MIAENKKSGRVHLISAGQKLLSFTISGVVSVLKKYNIA